MHDRIIFTKQNSEQSSEHLRSGDDGWNYMFIAP